MTRSDWSCWRSAWWLVTMLLGAGLAGCSGTREGSAGRAQDPRHEAQPRIIETVATDSGSSSASVKRGKQLFDTLGCTACHMVNGQGGRVGPDLSNEAAKGRSRPWLTTQIRTPKANDPQTTMPAYGSLSDEQVNDLVDYLLSLSTAPDRRPAKVLPPDRQKSAARRCLRQRLPSWQPEGKCGPGAAGNVTISARPRSTAMPNGPWRFTT